MQWNHFEIYKNSTETLHTDYLNKYPLWFERVDDPIRLTRLFQRYWQHTIGISIGYYLIIKIIQRQMYTSKPYELRRALIVWNACLALFSLCGLIRFTEDVLHSLVNYGLYKSICYSCHPGAATAYWSLLFAVSKFVELGDTLFIVLRKRPLIFLHYYHHAAVLIYTIHSGAEHAAAGRIFIWMNYLAHTFMYSYYTASACGLKLPRWIPIFVTTVQTTQMLVGVLISICIYFIKTAGYQCQQSYTNLYLSFIIYITFALLFVQFFIKSYITKTKKAIASEKKID